MVSAPQNSRWIKVLALREQGAHSTKMHTLLKSILYRADSEDLFLDTTGLQRQNESRKRKSTALAAQIVQQSAPRSLSDDFVLYGSLVDHVRTIGILVDGRVVGG